MHCIKIYERLKAETKLETFPQFRRQMNNKKFREKDIQQKKEKKKNRDNLNKQRNKHK